MSLPKIVCHLKVFHESDIKLIIIWLSKVLKKKIEDGRHIILKINIVTLK